MESSQLLYRFDEEAFDVEFGAFLSAWRKTWVPSGHSGGTMGPLVLRTRPEFLTPADDAEVAATQRLVEYCSSAIALAHLSGNAKWLLIAYVFYSPTILMNMADF